MTIRGYMCSQYRSKKEVLHEPVQIAEGYIPPRTSLYRTSSCIIIIMYNNYYHALLYCTIVLIFLEYKF